MSDLFLNELNELTAPVGTDIMHVRRNSDTSDPDKRMLLDKLVLASGAQTIAGAKSFSSVIAALAGINFGQGVLNNYTPNTLYTPVLTGSVSNPSVTYAAQTGSWGRNGDKIEYEFQIGITAVSGGSGDVRISLPHTSSKAARGALEPTNINFGGVVPVAIFFAPLGAFGVVRAAFNNAAVSVLQCSQLAAGQFLIGSGFYWVTP